MEIYIFSLFISSVLLIYIILCCLLMEIDLFSAAAYGEYETIDELLHQVGIRVMSLFQAINPNEYINSQDSFGLTALMEGFLSVSSFHQQLVEIIEKKYISNIHVLKQTVQYLLSHQANPDIQDKNGCCALHYAVSGN